MADIRIDIGGEIFHANFEAAAPQTVAQFRTMLPYRDRIIHVRWSGEACWIPMGERDFGVGYENATRHPAPGQIIIHPGQVSNISETEILLAYGGVSFASKAGPLAGNHFLTIEGDLAKLAAVCRSVLWDGAKDIAFTAA